LELQKPGGYWEPNEPASPTEENVLRKPANFLSWLSFLLRPGYVATNWRALVLSDLGLTSRDPRIGKVADLFFKYKLGLRSMIEKKNTVPGSGSTTLFITTTTSSLVWTSSPSSAMRTTGDSVLPLRSSMTNDDGTELGDLTKCIRIGEREPGTILT